MPGRGGIDALLFLADEAFRGVGIEASRESQSLLANLASVTDEQLRGRQAGTERTVEAIAIHVGACKVMYADYAFGPGTLRFGTPEVEPWSEARPAPRAVLVAWLEAAHGRIVDAVRALPDDSELDRPRPTNWGELRPTRWIVAQLITHDAYHAGEINHLRSLLDGDDRWRHVQLGFG